MSPLIPGRGRGRDEPPAEQPHVPAPSSEPSTVEQRHGPGDRGTTAPEIHHRVDPRPHPTGEREEQTVPPGETDPRYVGYQGQPILVGGDGGDAVRELAALLADAGYETPVSNGAADPILTDDVFAAVRKFQRDNDVEEEYDKLGVDERDAIIGPATWAALARSTGVASEAMSPAEKASARRELEL